MIFAIFLMHRWKISVIIEVSEVRPEGAARPKGTLAQQEPAYSPRPLGDEGDACIAKQSKNALGINVHITVAL